ncbi:hypothetical protein F5Y18DRAFT_439515 [Xylariaceae sp. FL1019]|nr:hypothetical protein F5Y18DRAFT_439515 [Xylariaceae sp. FL1019]
MKPYITYQLTTISSCPMSLSVIPRPGQPGHQAYWLGRASADAVRRGYVTRTTATSAVPVTVEVFVSSLWALHLKGLERVYQSLAAKAKGAEISYDVGRAAFRIKCLPQMESELIAIVESTLTELTSSTEDTSNLVMPIDDWRSNVSITADTREVYERYTYPVNVALYEVRETWMLDEELPQKGVTTETLLPPHAQSEIERLTSTQLVQSCDGRTIYIGAHARKDATKAKNKLSNLAECLLTAHKTRRQEMAIVLHNDGDRSQVGEYRYVKDGNAYLLKSFLLDPTFRNKEEAYLEIFHHAVIVRMVSSRTPCILVPSLGDNIRPVAEGPNSTERFEPFSCWRYRAKARIIPTPQPLAAIKAASFKPSTSEKMLNTEQWISEVPNTEPQHGEVVSTQKSQASRSLSSTVMNSDRVVKTRTSRQESIMSESPQQHDAQRGESQHEQLKNAPHEEAESFTAQQQQAQKDDKQSAEQESAQKEKARLTRLFQEVMEGKPAGEQPANSLPVLPRKSSMMLDGSDPFSNLWTSARASHTGDRSSIRLDTRIVPRVQRQDERNSRSYHTTMDQKAPSRRNKRPKPVKVDLADSAVTTATTSRASRTNSPSRTMAQVVSHGSTPEITQFPSSRTMAQVASDGIMQESNHSVAPRTVIERPHYPNLDPRMVQQLNNFLTPVLVPFQLSQGQFEFRAELGRLLFQSVSEKKVQIWGDDEAERHYEIGHIVNDCSTKYRPAFTRVLSSLGADANFISRVLDAAGNIVWSPLPNSRQTFYQFQCIAESERGRGDSASFWIDVSANDLTFKFRDDNAERRIYGVHCTKRVWDFRLVLTAQQDLTRTCGGFAKSLIDSLQITPSNSTEAGRLPQLKFTIPESFCAGVTAVRVCNVVSFTRKVEEESLKLDISEVWDLHTTRTPRRVQDDSVYVSHERGLRKGDTAVGDIPKWYEASIQAKTFCNAFEENRQLEFGERANWTAEELRKTKALDRLVRAAVDMVHEMDGVGFWNNCGFDDVWRKATQPPKSRLVNSFW